MIIDTHCHLYDEAFDTDRAEAVERALQAGVGHILLPNIDRSTVKPMLDLCQRYPGTCYPMIGLHPTDLGTAWRDTLDWMEAQLPGPYIAIGEVGLDYYWSREQYEEQQEAFERQVGWAECHQLPLMIHCRKAHRELMDIMRRHPGTTGVFHCFSGSAEEARELLEFPGFMLGIGGVLTFKKCKLPAVLATEVPIERIVLETDSPYLAPTPHRGERNESALLPLVVDALATIYDMRPEDVTAATETNARRVFRRLDGALQPTFQQK